MTTNIELAKQIARHVTLESISLKKAVIESDLIDGLPDEVGLSQQYRCRFEKVETADAIKLRVFVDFQFFAKRILDGAETGDAASLDATFVLSYLLPQAFDAEERCYSQFAEVNGPYNVWPYWRELVQTATGRIGLSGITVPVFRPPVVEIEDGPTCE